VSRTYSHLPPKERFTLKQGHDVVGEPLVCVSATRLIIWSTAADILGRARNPQGPHDTTVTWVGSRER